jgi:hypothetical protein
VAGPELPPWERFQKFAAIISRVPKADADKQREMETGKGSMLGKTGAPKKRRKT